MTRRSFVTAVGAAALVPASGLLAHVPRHLFFDAPEACFIEAACARLIPADTHGPGAPGADVCRYVDAQLAGAWGAGVQLYRSGPWQPGSPLAQSGAASPAALFRSSLRVIGRTLGRHGVPFARMPVAAQDAFLETLHSAPVDVGVPREFFPLLLQLTAEAFFSDPQASAARGVIAWPMSGFPGACATPS